MAKLNGENVSLNIHIESLLHERENIILEYQKLFNSIKKTRAQHQREFKAKLKTVGKGKNVNTKFDESTTLRKLICVTPMNKNKDLKAKMVSKVEVKKDESKPVTSCSKPKMRVASSSSVSRPESKDGHLKKRVLFHTKSKSTSKDVKKSHSSVSLVSNKGDTLNSNIS
ncbi:hypothetical protein Tco_1046555 [Tanacetum coccineum]